MHKKVLISENPAFDVITQNHRASTGSHFYYFHECLRHISGKFENVRRPGRLTQCQVLSEIVHF